MIIVNNLCGFHDMYTSVAVTFVKYFNGRNKDIYYYLLLLLLLIIIIIIVIIIIINFKDHMYAF